MPNSAAVRQEKVKPMDELEKRLREDAARIEARVTPEFEARMRASLERAEAAGPVGPVRRRTPLSLWWASSLTGIAAAAAVIVAINLDSSKPPPAPSAVPEALPEIVPPIVPDLRPESAILTAPLRQELEDLESDLEKAERALREDIRIPL